jgi:transcription antitermination factor NusG
MTLTGQQLGQSDSPLWFCVQTQPKRERLAATSVLQISGTSVFAPRIRFKRPTRRGPVWFVEALFPGYIFARFIFPLLHRQIQHLPGICTFVRFGDALAIVDESTIDRLRSASGDQELIVFNPELQMGDEVQITAGPFRGLEGVITQLIPSRERVKVLLEFLGRQLEAELQLPELLPNVSPRAGCGQEPGLNGQAADVLHK